MSDPKIIHQNDYIEVIQTEDRVAIKQKNPSVMILPYTIDSNGNPLKIGLIAEPSQIKESKIT
jgi:hypothetical protein